MSVSMSMTPGSGLCPFPGVGSASKRQLSGVSQSAISQRHDCTVPCPTLPYRLHFNPHSE